MRRLLSTRKELPCSPRPSSLSSVLFSSLHLPCFTTHACSAEGNPDPIGSKGHNRPLGISLSPIHLTWCIGFKNTSSIMRYIH
nr:MAG TPA: hypothetical protein [Caudoviricetes sp.]